MSEFEKTLSGMGVTLPEAPVPAANYVPYVRIGDTLYVSGQIAKDGDRLITGKLGADMDVAAGPRRHGPAPSPCSRRSRRPATAISTVWSGWSS